MPYYHILLLIYYHGLKTKQQHFINNALLLILVKIWNGRKSDFLKFCNPQVMGYVVTHMISAKYHIATHDTPLNLLSNYFVGTITSKYGPEIVKDSTKLKNIFMQCYARIYQIFSQNVRTNPTTGKREATGGIAPLYYSAYTKGLSLSSQKVKEGGDDDSGPGFDEFNTVHIRNEISQTTTDHIVLNNNPVYPQDFIKSVNDKTRVSSKVLETMFKSVHNPKYHDLIYDVYTLILGKLNIKEKEDICSSSFEADLKKKIISSKNNPEANKIQKILDSILIDSFNNLNLKNLDFKKYSNVQKIQIRSSLVYVLIYQLKKNICHLQVTAGGSYSFISTIGLFDI